MGASCSATLSRESVLWTCLVCRLRKRLRVARPTSQLADLQLIVEWALIAQQN